jgi:putative colanic acid biosynthesis acetyltransferase WcaF
VRNASRSTEEWSLSEFVLDGYDKGRNVAWQASWFATMNLIFTKWWCPKALRVALLRLFGASIGQSVVIRHRVRVLWPWKLTIGDHSWIGEGSWLLNLEPISIGRDVCVSQEVYMCTGSHDRTHRLFRYDNAPITVADGCWIATQALILRGVSIGRNTVVGARAIVSRSTLPHSLIAPGSRP